MSKFFEGGQREVSRTLQNNTAKARIGTLVKNLGKSSARKTTREIIARQAQKQYTTGTPTRDSGIVKAWLDTINSPAQEQSGLVKTPSAPSRGYTFKGQYGGAGTQSKDYLQSIIPTPRDFKQSAQFAAKRDTSTDPVTQHFYDKYAIPQEAHRDYIALGDSWMTDQNALTDWILGGVDYSDGYSEEEYEAACARQKQYEDYMSRYLRSVSTFDPDSGSIKTEQQFTADAPLPPWIPPTGMNWRAWEYYVTYAHDVVQSTADAYTAAFQQGQDNAKHPYKSAFSTDHQDSDVDSFLDILISSKGFNDFKVNTQNYFRDYIINPLKSGKFLTAGGNALWNLMDTMDIASRGVRAFVAGDSVLGGIHDYSTKSSTILKNTGNTFLGDRLSSKKSYEHSKPNDATFKGQNVYWVQLEGKSAIESQRAQERFLQNGGYALLLKAHPGEAGKDMLGSKEMSMPSKELEAMLDAEFKDSGIDWHEIYNDIESNFFSTDRAIQDVKQAIENVENAYSDPAANFNADTGSIGADILIESVLDPGLVMGGMAKNIAKGSVRSAADNAIESGFRAILRDSDSARDLLKSKQVKSAISEFVSSNEGKNIIFKNSKRFDEDVEILIKRLSKDTNLLSTEAARDTFKRTISAHLLGKHTTINGNIIESTAWARKVIDTKTFKAAYYMDKAIDGIDSAIVKSSFAAPWALVKGTKGIKQVALNNTAVGKYFFNKRLQQAAAAMLVRDDVTKAVDVTKVSDLLRKLSANEVDVRSGSAALNDVVRQYDNLSRNINALIPKAASGELTKDEVLKIISDSVQSITGGKYSRITDLSAEIADYDIRYAKDIQLAFDRLVQTQERLNSTIEDAVDNVNTYFSEKAITQSDVRKGMAAYQRSVSGVAERSISVKDFRSMLEKDFQDLLRGFYKPAAGEASYPNVLGNLLEPDEAVTDFSFSYIKSQIDLATRSIEFSTIKDPKYFTGETSRLLSADPRMHELRRLRAAVQNLDMISLKDVEVVTTLHTDRMAMFQAFSESAGIKTLFDKGYNSIIAPVMDTFLTKYVDDVDLSSESLFKDLLRIRELKYGYDRTNSLRAELGALHGLSDKKIHTVINGLGNNFGRPYGSLQDVVRSPGVLRKNLELTTRTQFGMPKIGISGLTDMLRSVDSSAPSKYLEPYMKEFEDPIKGPELKAWFDSITNGDPLDSSAYIDKQMLATLLMDPSLIDDYNRLAKEGNAPIFFHISTSGLSSEINEITSVSYRKWVPIEYSDTDLLTLEKIKAAFDTQDSSGAFRRGLSDAEINAISENNLRHMADWKGMNSSQIRAEYKKFFGASDSNPLRSEDALLEDVCSFINDASISTEDGLVSQVPHLVVHDSDGFNIPFFNRKVAEASRYSAKDSKIFDYSRRLSNEINGASFNTYDRLAQQFEDSTFTSDELDQITRVLTNYIEDIGRFAGDNYNITDFSEYYEVFRRIVSTAHDMSSDVVELSDDVFYELKQAIYAAADEANYADMIVNYNHALTNVSDLSLYPKQFVYTSSGEADNAVYEALKATGRDTINVESRIYVKDVLSYFDIADADTGLNVSFDALNRMHNLSQYIIRNRDNAMAQGAAEFLQPYKTQFDAFINAVTAEGKHLMYSSSEFEFLGNLKIPDTAVESYLMAQKLYDDYAKYWLSSDQLTSFARSSEELDTLKAQLKAAKISVEGVQFQLKHNHDELRSMLLNSELKSAEAFRDEVMDWVFEQTCDHINNFHTKHIGEMMRTFGGGMFGPNDAADDIVRILEGSNRPDIFKAAANADYTKTVYSYKEGVLQEGIELASKVSEANSKIRSEIRQLESIDAFYRNAGLNKISDKTTGMLFAKTKRLFDILDSTGLTRRESFQTFIKRASEIQSLKVQQYSIDFLKTDGGFDRSKLLSELVWNDCNHVVYNSHAFSKQDMDSLKGFVNDLQKNGDDFLSLYEDKSTGNIFIYLNYNAQITSDGTNRFINNVEMFNRPVKDVIEYASFDELKEFIDLDDIEDFREVYDQLLSCWEDTRMLSAGHINGTSGKVITRKHMEDYLNTLPSQLEDMLPPRGMLVSDTARGIVYDPGFIANEDSDMLLDFLGTLSRQADEAKEDAILINEVFSGNSSLKFNELTDHFTDEELMDYFGNNPDYVVVTLTPNSKTRSGLQVQQLKVDNLASVKVAKEAPNTTILPYDMYYEIAETMNRIPQEGYYRRLLGKYMLAYKAFSLVKPGTWMRNYIDATAKAAMDGGRDITNMTSLLPYQMRAAQGLGAYSRILKADPALVTKSNWELIQKTFKTDLTFEEFELLRGVIDSSQFKSADKYFMNKTAMKNSGRTVIAGDNAGLRGLEETDITAAFNKYLASEADLPLSQADFLDLYLGRKTADAEVMDQFEEMMRKLSINMRNADEASMFDKTINLMFKPFGAVEGLARYSQTLYLLDQGLSQNQVLKHIHMTQFYTAPSWGTFNKLETIMPFITFRYNNFMYWMRMMDENPRFFRYFDDIYGTIANDTIENMMDDGQDVDYASDTFLQSGDLPLGENGAYLKIGNSFLSAINDFYGGPNMLIGKRGGLNPLLRETLRFSIYALGLNSKDFFSDVDLDVSNDVTSEGLAGLLPGGNLGVQFYKYATNLPNTFDEEGGPSMDTLFQTLSFLGVLGVRKNYSSGGKIDYSDWQDELAAQGKWYDANLGKLVSLSDKNEYGANDPNNTWEDVQAYTLEHFGKIWDPNQHKFVKPEDFMQGNYDVDFDFENDPEAWNKLQAWMRVKGKVYDYNQRKFVLQKDYISGGLNDPNITFEKKAQLMDEKFGLVWDGNQNTWVTRDRFINGGLNDTKSFNEVKSLRLALYGEVYQYDPETGKKKFVKVQEPAIVTAGSYYKNEEYDEYFSRLAIPRLQNVDATKFHIDKEGFLVTEDGKYILTRNAEYNQRLFEKFKYTFTGRGRKYYGHKRRAYKAFAKKNKPYKGHLINAKYYTGYGWNDKDGYYRLNYQFTYQYHNPQPRAKLNRLLSPRINYPYGGGYNKFSFYTR